MKGDLVWRKENLPSSDGQDVEEGTHITGQFRFSQAGWEVGGKRIDQTQYFRHDVFDDLNWRQNDGKEVANARFRILYSGDDFGVSVLEIVHDPSWESDQDGVTTHLRWGDMLDEVKENMVLQGKDFDLYTATSDDCDFVIDIS
jgi:hypothetical protein